MNVILTASLNDCHIHVVMLNVERHLNMVLLPSPQQQQKMDGFITSIEIAHFPATVWIFRV